MTSSRPANTALAAAVLLALSPISPVGHAATPTRPGPSPEPAGVPTGAPAAVAHELDTVEVRGATLRKASSHKYTEPLRDTPQTVTVVDRDVLDQQNLLGLREILSNLPGITFGAGEGGGGYGDSITLRGFTAGSDITTDGVRDSALYSRSDSFNLEAVELVNGANSAMSGAGSVGGSINLVSKTAREGDAHAFTLGVGSDGYGRATADSNIDFGAGTALRLNAMVHENDIAGRDHEFANRQGFAPSLAFGLGTSRRVAFSALHQDDTLLPQYGVPYALNPYNDGPLPGIDRETYFGYRNIARQDSTVDMLTGSVDIDFNDRASLRTLARWQRVDQTSTATAPGGTWCLDDGTNPYTGQACTSGQPAGTWSPLSGPRGYRRDTRNTIAVVQSDLTLHLGGERVAHTLVAGASLSRETFALETGGLFFDADGSAVPNTNAGYPLMDIHDPYNIWTGPVHYFRSGKSEGDLDNRAAYLFDTIKFGRHWQLSLGARHERNAGASTGWVVSTADATRGRLLSRNPAAENTESLFSYRAGVVYKPVEQASLYLAWSNSRTPSRASVNGSCTPAGTGTGTSGTANCEVAPESAANFELGGKWDLPGRRLALTAALFRNERTHYRVSDPGNPQNPSGEQQLDGRARVDGVVLGVAGQLTDRWSVFANYTWLDSEVLRGVSRSCLDQPRPACGNSATDRDPFAGNPLVQTPEHSGSVWTQYTHGDWRVGYGATYQGGFLTQNNTLDGRPLFETEDWWVHRLMVGYAVGDRLDLQLNIENLLDETYYTRIRNNITFTGTTVTGGAGWAVPGAARSFVLTARWRF